MERHFEKCFDSLIKMDYIHETFIFLYDTEAEREFMSRKMFKAYPMLLEYSKFLPKRKYASVEAIQKEFIDEECILVQLPMQSRFVGSQAFKLLNKVFHDDPETKVVLAPSMMLINENKSEVREVGSEMVRSSEDVLNFHKSNNGLLAVKLEK